ncbi:hypothetical protein CLV31_10178 [Algoriphagus aquaeductus]|uniref:Electron transfer DM13 n=1 Tax=Algoriphagus aquaeductus TaxID=475299 RepID=A0A326SAP1_9BACT|nr:hypothetical protein [Algoriphagus aquaeductus]PZV87206.1 hypothetical protein CLV31_10178 [Algoriphagus aquaeductus]
MKKLIQFYPILFALLMGFAGCDNMGEEMPMNASTEIEGPLEVLKRGTLSNQSGAGTRGTMELLKGPTNKYYIGLSENFTTKFSTGTVTVYLSTSASLRLNESGSFMLLGLANRPGVHFFELPGSLDPKFTHGIIWCGAAGIPFGNTLLE